MVNAWWPQCQFKRSFKVKQTAATYERQAKVIQEMLGGERNSKQVSEKQECEIIRQRVASMTMKEPLQAAYIRRAAAIQNSMHDKLRESAVAIMRRK